MTTIAGSWQLVSRHKIIDAVVVLLAAAAIVVTLVLTLGNESASNSGPSGSPAHPAQKVAPQCHWMGKPTYC